MFIHNVYFWLNPGTSESQKADFKEGIHTFLSSVPEVQRFEIGQPANTPKRDVVDNSFGYSIFVWFKNVSDHDIYQKHPVHDVFIEKYKDLWAKVEVKDSFLL